MRLRPRVTVQTYPARNGTVRFSTYQSHISLRFLQNEMDLLRHSKERSNVFHFHADFINNLAK